MQVPVVDLNAAEHKVRAAIHAACGTLGFFMLRGHGIQQTELQQCMAASEGFFHLPAKQKASIRRTADNPWGYFDAELTKNKRDWKEILDIGSQGQSQLAFPKARTQWPAQPQELRSVVQQHMAHCERIADRLLAYIAENLGVGHQVLQQHFGTAHTSFLRLNYYPVCPDAAASPTNNQRLVPTAGSLGISHHTDAGALTLLLQDQVSGLQVWQANRWLTVPTDPDALVINIGDVVQVWSNNQYPAPVHRVLANGNRERFSTAYFYNPSYDANYAPLESMGKPQYRSINWGEFRAGRSAGDYADNGEELQISHYAI